MLLTPGRLKSFGNFSMCCLVLWGGNAGDEVSISQVPEQSVLQHVRPRTGLKGVAQAEVKEILGKQVSDEGPLRRVMEHFPWSPAKSLVAGLLLVQQPQDGGYCIFLSC